MISSVIHARRVVGLSSFSGITARSLRLELLRKTGSPLAFSAMATNDRWQEYLDAGRAWTQMTRGQAEAVVKDLVKRGELQQKRARKAVDELLERSRKNAEELRKIVSKEIQSQISALGIATKDDLARLERKLSKAGAAKKTAAAKKATTAKKDSPTTSAAGG